MPASTSHVSLAKEAYGLSVLKIREIIRQQRITHVPQLPKSTKGVINLRGRVIPIIDLRLKLGLEAETTDHTCIVVVEVVLQSGRSSTQGLIVDGVDEVANVPAENIEPTPEFGVGVDTSFILGIAKVKGQVIMLLDVDQVVGPEVDVSGLSVA